MPLASPSLGREGRVEAVGLPLERWPGEQVGGQRYPDLPLLRCNFRRALWRIVDGVAGRQRHDLRLARALEEIEPHEALADILADGQSAVIAEDHRILGAEGGH